MKAVKWVVACVFCLSLGAIGAEDKKDEGKFDAAKMIGTWKYVSGEKNGEKVAGEALAKQTVTIAKDTIVLQGDQKFVIKYELDTGKTPVGIKMTITESPFGGGAKAAGIVRLKDDELTLCYAPESEEAPKKFSTKDSKAHLFVLKRSKK